MGLMKHSLPKNWQGLEPKSALSESLIRFHYKEAFMQIRKAAAALAALALVAFAGCGGGGGSSSSASSSASVDEIDWSIVTKHPGGTMVVSAQEIGYPGAEIELTWQPNPGQSLTSTVPALIDDLTAKLTAWVEAHPNVKITVLGTTGSINDFMTKLRLDAAQGNAPDLAAVDSFVMPLYREYGRDISDVAQRLGIDYNDYFPFIKEEVLVGNELRALWFTTDARALYYRKDIIDTPPATVDELIDVAKRVSQERGMTGFIYVGGRGEGSINNLWGLYWCQGGEITNPDGTMAIDKEPNKTYMINLFNFVKRTIDEGITPVSVVNYDGDLNMVGDAAAGNVAMFLGNTAMINQMRAVMGEEFDRLWAIAPTPVMEAGQVSTCSAGGWTNMVFSRDELHRVLAAELAIALYSSDEAAETFLPIESSMPCLLQQYEKFDFIKSDPYYVQIVDYLETANTRPAVEAYNIISVEAQVALGNVITGAATPEEAVEAIIRNVNRQM